MEIGDKSIIVAITQGVLELVQEDSPVKLEPRIFNRDGIQHGSNHWRGEITRPDGRRFEIYYDPDDGMFTVTTRFPNGGRREAIDFDLAEPDSFEQAAYEILNWDIAGVDHPAMEGYPKEPVKISPSPWSGKVEVPTAIRPVYPEDAGGPIQQLG